LAEPTRSPGASREEVVGWIEKGEDGRREWRLPRPRGGTGHAPATCNRSGWWILVGNWTQAVNLSCDG